MQVLVHRKELSILMGDVHCYYELSETLRRHSENRELSTKIANIFWVMSYQAKNAARLVLRGPCLLAIGLLGVPNTPE